MEESQDPFSEFDVTEQQETQPTSTRAVETNFIEVYSKNDCVNSLQDAMNKYDANIVNTQVIRQQLIDKLLPDVMSMDLSSAAGTDPDLFAAQSKMIAETRSLLNDMDTASKNHISIKLKQKDSESQASIAFNAAELLNRIKLNSDMDRGSVVVQDANVIENAIQKKFDDGNMVILDTELEEGISMLPKKEENNN